ncbi:hypothetical protein C8A03DRAFT_30005 [Achaetomium macrosporum]|uniref:Uncharacterized protein n=1 Tax=Achaetomium macrosporum TaxID=79813 RepID=A0AAN7CIQ4_9PEZI|nr:hypothetical protein C8A03DRAFT_30005 [Achaetomium macrosporum]
MAPIRRYLRITKYSVLECRIYLDNPALTQSWLLNPRDPILPKVIESVRPLVLPKLREEKERERSKKKNKKRSIKDVVVEDDFEVSIFLTETDTRHSLLHKQKLFRDKVQTRLTSNSSKLMGASRDEPIDVEDQFPHGTGDADVPILLEEDEDQGIVNLADIPAIDDETAADPEPTNRRLKRRRRGRTNPLEQGQEADVSDGGSDVEAIATETSADELFVGDEASDESDAAMRQPPPKRRKEKAAAVGDTADRDEKKKMAMDISYEGFAIYGRVLCLVVKRRGDSGSRGSGSAVPLSGRSQTNRPGGQAMMENWIASTQLPDADAGDAGSL